MYKTENLNLLILLVVNFYIGCKYSIFKRNSTYISILTFSLFQDLSHRYYLIEH
jgi:hypothetical protein